MDERGCDLAQITFQEEEPGDSDRALVEALGRRNPPKGSFTRAADRASPLARSGAQMPRGAVARAAAISVPGDPMSRLVQALWASLFARERTHVRSPGMRSFSLNRPAIGF